MTNKLTNRLRDAFEAYFHCERNEKGFYDETYERMMWLACKFGSEWYEAFSSEYLVDKVNKD